MLGRGAYRFLANETGSAQITLKLGNLTRRSYRSASTTAGSGEGRAIRALVCSILKATRLNTKAWAKLPLAVPFDSLARLCYSA